MKNFNLSLFLILSTLPAASQSIKAELRTKVAEQAKIEQLLDRIKSEVEGFKLKQVKNDLRQIGLSAGEQIEHTAIILSYAEAHEQASWVAHIIRPEVTDGRGARTNNFREAPLIATGLAQEKDYFLKLIQKDSSYTYDGFGYDRGH